jgi:ribosome-associated protein
MLTYVRHALPYADVCEAPQVCEDALQRLVGMIREAAKPPPPKRRPTRPTKASVERRLKSKTARGSVKKLRGPHVSGD